MHIVLKLKRNLINIKIKHNFIETRIQKSKMKKKSIYLNTSIV